MEKLAFKFPGGNRIEPVAGMPEGGTGALQKIITYGLTIAFIAITITSLIFIIWAGISWITSQGDKSKIEAARKRVVYSIIGLMIAFSSYLIINLISEIVGLQLIKIPGA